MNEQKFKNDIIEEIKTKKVKPWSRWRFLFLDWLWWGLFVLSVLLGSAVLSVAISFLVQNDWHFYNQVIGLTVGDIISSLPFVWLILLLVLIILARLPLRFTRSGYRLRTFYLIGVSLSLSLFIGSFSFFVGWGDNLEYFSSRIIPYYQKLNPGNIHFWTKPEVGFLGGYIIAIADGDNLIIRDFTNHDWMVYGNNISWLGGAEPKIGSQVKIIGRADNQEKFVFMAKEIRLWRP